VNPASTLCLSVLLLLGGCRTPEQAPTEPPSGGAENQPGEEPQPGPVTLSATDAEVRTVIRHLATVTELNLVLGSDVQGRVSIDLRSVTAREALVTIASAGGLVVTTYGAVHVVTREPPQVPQASCWEPLGEEPRLTLELVDLDLHEAAAALGRAAGRPIAVLGRRGRRVSLNVADLPWDLALAQVAEQCGQSVEFLPGGTAVLSTPPSTPVTLTFDDTSPVRALAVLAQQAHLDVLLPPTLSWAPIAVSVQAAPAEDVLRATCAAAGFSEERFVEVTGLLPRDISPTPLTTEATPRITLDAVDARLAKVLEEIEANLEDHRVRAQDPYGWRVTISLHDVPWLDAVQALARVTQCKVHERDDDVVLTRRAYVHLRLSRADLRLVLSTLAARARRRLKLPAEVQGEVCAVLRAATSIDALRRIARAWGLELKEERGSLVIRGPGLQATYPPRPPSPGLNLTPPPPPDPRALEDELEADLEGVLLLARAQDTEELNQRLIDLRSHLSRGGPPAVDLLERLMHRHRSRLSGLGLVALSLELQVCVQRGNDLLRAMADLPPLRWAEVAELENRLAELVVHMRGQELAVFDRNADALEARGPAIADRVWREVQVLSLAPLQITGLLLGQAVHNDLLTDLPPHANPWLDPMPTAIVDGQTYEVPHGILDPVTGKWIRHLWAYEASLRGVRFVYQDIEVWRELEPIE
jgi:hypothetical protein